MSAVALFMLASIYVDRHMSLPTAWHFFASAAFACGAAAEIAHVVLAVFASGSTEVWGAPAWFMGLSIKVVLLGFGIGMSWMQMHRSTPTRLVISIGMVLSAGLVAGSGAIAFLVPREAAGMRTVANVALIGAWLLIAVLSMRLPMMRALAPVGLVEFCVMMAGAHVVMSMASHGAFDTWFFVAHVIKVAAYGPLLRLFLAKPNGHRVRMVDPSDARTRAALEWLKQLAKGETR